MNLDNRLVLFFKNKRISNRVLAERTGYSETMVGRYLKKPNYAFLSRIIENYPDIDLNYILKNDTSHLLKSLEPDPTYELDNQRLLRIMEEVTKKLKENLSD